MSQNNDNRNLSLELAKVDKKEATVVASLLVGTRK